ncbi:MAG: hypothetical protein KJT03_03405 [Verrucomicrobiae bacterium]|nr:hypothetical protein [Verrucomicrobiae bacterium]
MKTVNWILLLILPLFWMGCNSTDYRIKKFPDRFAALSAEEQEAVNKKTLDIGYSAEVVYFIMGEPDRKKVQVKDGKQREIWVYTRIYTRPEGTHLAGYERRVYYDSKANVYRVYYVPHYVHTYSEHQEIATEIEFENGIVSAITEYDS